MNATRVSSLGLVCLFSLAAACGDDGGSTADPDGGVNPPDAAAPDAMLTVPLAPDGAAAVIASATSIDVTWNDNSDDEDGFRVERRVAGTIDFVSAGTVAAGVATFTDTAPPNGGLEYRVFAYNPVGDSDPSELASVVREIPVQDSTLSVDLTTLDVTVGGPGTELPLTVVGKAVWDGVGNDMTISLSAENLAGRLLFNLKAIITNLNDGAASAVGEGLYAGDPYFHFGPNATELGASAAKDIVITGVSGGQDPLTMDVSLVNHPMVFTVDGYYNIDMHMVDLSGIGDVKTVDMNPHGRAGNGAGTGGGGSSFTGTTWSAMTADGRHAYFGLRNQPMIVILDTLSMTFTEGADLTGGNNIKHDGDGSGSYGFTRGVVLSPDDAYLYVTLSHGMHSYAAADGKGPGLLEVVKIQRNTMAIVGRVTLYASVSSTSPTQITLSADGSRGAVSTRVYYDSGAGDAQSNGKVFVFNTSDMSIVDGDPAAGDQAAPFDLSAVGISVRRVALAPDGTKVYVAFLDAGDNAIRVIDIATGAVTTVTPPNHDFISNDGSAYFTEMRFGPDGRLYITDYYEGLTIYNPGANSWVEFGVGSGGRAIEFSGDGSYYLFFDQDGSVSSMIDMSNDTPMAFPATGDMTTNLACSSHSNLMTPF